MNFKIIIVSAIVLNSALITASECQSSKIDCKSLTESDSALYHPEGLIDNIGAIDPQWLGEKIEVGDFYLWFSKHFNLSITNVIDTSKVDEELKRRGEHAIKGNKEVEWLLQQVKSGDELWYYTTPQIYWDSLSGRDGIVVVRKCRIVAEIIFSQS
jgi:hypothetical protein